MKTESLLVSIVVPAYNTEDYIENCVDSILSQSYKIIEVILVDDHSCDRTEEICQTYSMRDNRVVYVRNDVNKGLAESRNIGVRRSSGDLITFIDGDDFIEKTYIENYVNEFVSDPNLEVVIGTYVRDFGCGSLLHYYKKGIRHLMNRKQAIEELMSCTYFCWEIPTKMYKREIFNKVSFDKNLRSAEDMKASWQIFNIAEKFCYICELGYHYMVRNGSLTLKPVADIPFYHLAAASYIFEDNRKSGYRYESVSEKMSSEILTAYIEAARMGCLEKYIHPDNGRYITELNNYRMKLYNVLLEESRKLVSVALGDEIAKIVSCDMEGLCESYKNKFQRIKSAKRLYLYGAGRASLGAKNLVTDILHRDIEAFVIGNGRKMEKSPDMTHEVVYLSQIIEDEGAVLLMATSLFNTDSAMSSMTGKEKMEVAVW